MPIDTFYKPGDEVCVQLDPNVQSYRFGIVESTVEGLLHGWVNVAYLDLATIGGFQRTIVKRAKVRRLQVMRMEPIEIEPNLRPEKVAKVKPSRNRKHERFNRPEYLADE